MSDATNRRFEIGSHMQRMDDQGTNEDEHGPSERPEATYMSNQDGEEDRVLTKVADLLDDVTESDPDLQPSLSDTASSDQPPDGPSAPNERPSLNSTWQQASLNRQRSQQHIHDQEDVVDGSTLGTPLSASPGGPSLGESDPIDAENQQDKLDVDHVSEPSPDSNISIKGRGDGVAIELGHGDWNRLIARLDARLEQAAAFFRGGQVSLDVGSRPLVEAELDELCGILQKYGLTVGIIRTGSDRTFQSALNLGLAATMENAGGEPQTEATFAASNLGGQTHFVYRGNLRSGQILQRQESILVIGDVNPGGHLVSAGDILVWGRLRGVAHAGSEGDLNVIVGALSLQPTQLRIASIIAIDNSQNDKQKREKGEEKPAQIAFITEGKLVVQPWHTARRGFRSVLLGT